MVETKSKTRKWAKMCVFALEAGTKANREMEEESKQRLRDMAIRDGVFNLSSIGFKTIKGVSSRKTAFVDHYIFSLTGDIYAR